MIVERFVTPELAQVAYAVGDQQARKVALIDPRRDIGEYVEWARSRGMHIVAILETHVHADFVSGATELATATGAPVYAGRLGRQDIEHVPVDDGRTLDIGSVRLTALHTPGHTPEHMSWVAENTSDPDAALVMFSGDALFVGDVGRPDLHGAGQTSALARDLYATVTHVFKRMPDDTIVYPGHMAGSSCGRAIGSAPHTTIGSERATNYAFKPGSEAEFVEAVTSAMPAPPTYYPLLKKVNRLGAHRLSSLNGLHALPVERVEDLLCAGAMVIDIRSQEEFAAGHIPGSVFVGVGPHFSSWMGWLAPYGRDIVLITSDTPRAREALTMLRRIGIDRVVGYHIGVRAWEESGRPLAPLPVTDPHEVMAEQANGKDPLVVDVRNDSEFDHGHIDGAMHHFLGSIAQGRMPELDRRREITVVCGSGYRSTVAASLMMSHGFERLRNLAGGMTAWNERKAEIRAVAS